MNGWNQIAPRSFRGVQSLGSMALQFLVLSLVLTLPQFAFAQGAAPKAGLEVVKVGPPTTKPLAWVSTQPARIEPLEQTAIFPRVSAYIDTVAVDYGDKVKKGDKLITLSAPELAADLLQKKALAAQAEAEQAQAEAGVVAALTALDALAARRKQAEAEIGRAEADLARWKSELQRIQELVATGVVSKTLADETQQKFSAAEAALRQTQAAIAAAVALIKQGEAEVEKARADAKSAAAKIRVAEAVIQQSQAMVDYLTLTAPFDGVVVARKGDPGRLVQSSAAEPLLVIARTDKMRAAVLIPEAEAPFVDQDDPVLLEFPNLRGGGVEAKVSRTSGVLDENNRSLLVLIDLDNAAGALRPGLFCTAKVTLENRPSALTLPSAAVVRQGKAAFCYTFAGGKAVKTPLEIGIRVGDDWEILSGVDAKSQVVLNKAASLSDGQAVEPAQP